MRLIDDREGPAEIVILETRIDRVRGLVSSGVVKCGTVKKNSNFVVAKATGKVCSFLFSSAFSAHHWSFGFVFFFLCYLVSLLRHHWFRLPC